MVDNPKGSPSPSLGSSCVWSWSPILLEAVEEMPSSECPRMKSVAVLADTYDSTSTDEVIYEPIWTPLSPSPNQPPLVESVIADVVACKAEDDPTSEGIVPPCLEPLADSPNEVHVSGEDSDPSSCDGGFLYIADKTAIPQAETAGENTTATTLSIVVADESCMSPEVAALLAPSPSDCPHPSSALQAGITMTGNPLFGLAGPTAAAVKAGTAAVAVPAFLLSLAFQPTNGSYASAADGDDDVCKVGVPQPAPEQSLVTGPSTPVDSARHAGSSAPVPAEQPKVVAVPRQTVEVAVRPAHYVSDKVASKLHGVCKAVHQGGGGGAGTKKKQQNRKRMMHVTGEQQTVALSEALQQSSDLVKDKMEALKRETQPGEPNMEEEGSASQEQAAGTVATIDAEKNAKYDADTLAQLSSKLDNLTLCITTLQKERSAVPQNTAPAAPQAADMIPDAKGRRFIVFDTCSLIKHPLEAKECIRCLKYQRPDAAHSLLVPLEVVRELDGLKSNSAPATQSAARQAIYLLRAAASQVPAGVFRGQREGELLHGRARRGDSGILDCMLLFRAAGAVDLMLVTDDVNLSLRAVTEGFPCVSSSQAVAQLEHSLKLQGQDQSSGEKNSLPPSKAPKVVQTKPNAWTARPPHTLAVPVPPPPGLLKVLVPPKQQPASVPPPPPLSLPPLKVKNLPVPKILDQRVKGKVLEVIKQNDTHPKVLAPPKQLAASVAPPLPLPPLNHLPRILEQRARAKAVAKAKKNNPQSKRKRKKRKAKKVGIENIKEKGGGGAGGGTARERANAKRTAQREAQRTQMIAASQY